MVNVVLDFAILFLQPLSGTAIDYTEEMLREAQQNAGGFSEVYYVGKTGDAQALDVESNSFDAIVTRNVT